MSATPILDLEAEPPAPAKAKRWHIVAGVLLGAALGLTREFMPPLHLPACEPVLFLVFLYLGIALHEVGHLLAGHAVGFRAGALSVGGCSVGRSGEKLAFRFNPRLLMSGYYQPLPPPGEQRAKDFIVMIGAGPAVSLTLLLITALAVMRYGSGPGNWLGSAFWSAAVMGLLSLIPSRTRLNWTDVARIGQLRKHPEPARSWMALLTLQTANTLGGRPREWDAGLCGTAFRGDGNEVENSYRSLLAFYRHMDLDEEEEGLACLEKAIASSQNAGHELRIGMFQEAAFACAYLRRDPQKARVWLQRARAIGRPEFAAAAEGAIAMCEDRFEDALRHFDAAEAVLEKRRLDCGTARAAKATYAECRAECLAALQGQV